MAFDRFLIGPVSIGLQTDLKPFMVPDEAFTQLNNAYIFRGRVRKRFGSRLMGTDQRFSRFRIVLGTTNAITGNLSGMVPGNIFSIGQMFSIGTTLYTVITAGVAQSMLKTDATTTATYSTTNGAFNFVGAPLNALVYFYPSEPVMGLTLYESGAINNQPAYGFDTQFAYVFAGGAWERSITGITPVWHGDNANFFWVTNWQGITDDQVAMFVTNFQVLNYTGAINANDDPIWTFKNGAWDIFTPRFLTAGATPSPSSPSTVKTARLIVAFRNRLLLLNTVEVSEDGSTNSNFVNRCRFSQNGSPFNTGVMIGTTDGAGNISGTSPGPFLDNIGQYFVIGASIFTVVLSGVAKAMVIKGIGAGTYSTTNGAYVITGAPINTAVFLFNEPPPFLEQTQAGSHQAGFIDATTEEEIISAEFIKDRLIVYFERSTWELAYTGNEVQPFIWQKLNTELGSEATFSTVPFDKEVLTVGNVGVHSCNGSNVSRVDNLIPDQIFQIRNKNEGVARVAGIRDYLAEMVYWTFPNSAQADQQIFPNRILVYNYKNGAWAFNDDCITAFGYFEQQTGLTWATANFSWASTNATWSSGTIQANFRNVMAGNQQGFTFLVEPDISANASVMQITDITGLAGIVTLVIKNHTLSSNEFIRISNANGVDIDGIFQITRVDADIVTTMFTMTGVYLGGGTAARVSRIDIKTKQWNFYQNQGKNVYIQKIDFNVTKTTSGQITIDYFPSSTAQSMLQEAVDTGAAMGNGILATSPYDLVPLEKQQTQLWHPIFFQTDGETVQLRIFLNDDQMRDITISESDFELNAMLLYAQQISRLQ